MKCPWILLNALPSARDDDNGSCFKNYSFETSDRIKSPCPAYPTTRIRNSFSSSSSSSVRHNKAASPSSSSSSSRCRSLYRSNSGRASVVTGRNIKIGEYMNDFITVRYIICSSTLQKQTSCPFTYKGGSSFLILHSDMDSIHNSYDINENGQWNQHFKTSTFQPSDQMTI